MSKTVRFAAAPTSFTSRLTKTESCKYGLKRNRMTHSAFLSHVIRQPSFIFYLVSSMSDSMTGWQLSVHLQDSDASIDRKAVRLPASGNLGVYRSRGVLWRAKMERVPEVLQLPVVIEC